MLCGCGGGGAVLVYTSKGLAWFGAVGGCGAKQTSKGLVLGLVLRERIKSKG